MRRHPVKALTVLITRTGKAPITLSIHPTLMMGLLIAFTSLPIAWIGHVIYTYSQKNAALTQRNQNLTEQAADILNKVESLEAEINGLQRRAGMQQPASNLQSIPEAATHEEIEPQGGVGVSIGAETLLEVANAQLPGLLTTLKGEVQPALEATLDREEARPSGIPLKGGHAFSSEFGLRRNPFGRGYEFHDGLDLKAAYGSPIYATAAGVVVKVGTTGGYGYHVIVDHGYGYQTLYAHLSKIDVTQGMQIERDRIVGRLGNTGRSSGPHLHYGVYLNGNSVNPKYYLN